IGKTSSLKLTAACAAAPNDHIPPNKTDSAATHKETLLGRLIDMAIVLSFSDRPNKPIVV
ncbi:MAG: hypothetical protein JSU82_14205, partial [Rhodospirillales bacterium]